MRKGSGRTVERLDAACGVSKVGDFLTGLFWPHSGLHSADRRYFDVTKFHVRPWVFKQTRFKMRGRCC